MNDKLNIFSRRSYALNISILIIMIIWKYIYTGWKMNTTGKCKVKLDFVSYLKKMGN